MKQNFVLPSLTAGLSVLLLAAGFSVHANTQTASSPVAVGSVVITELMPNVNDSDIDWIELFNPTDAAIDLKGCNFSDDNSDHFLVDQSLSIAAGGYAVLASGASLEKDVPNALSSPAMQFSADRFQLVTGPDQVILTCAGQVIDKVSYQDYTPGPATQSRGWQLEPGSFDAQANDQADKWCYSVLSDNYVYGRERIASPGAINPMCIAVSLPYVYYNDQASALIDGIDFETTLKIAKEELAEVTSTSELTIWAIRDQEINAEIATTISALYFQYIEGLYDTEPFTILDWNHAVWHFAWAISNLYRNGDDSVKAALQLAYEDALERPKTLTRHKYIAIDHISGSVITMGDIHDRAHTFSTTHIVVPGNPEYLQSYEDYLDKKTSPFMRTVIHTLFKIKTFFDELMA